MQKLIPWAFYVVVESDNKRAVFQFIGYDSNNAATWYRCGDEEWCPHTFVKKVIRRVRL